jgi:hypothetical protein
VTRYDDDDDDDDDNNNNTFHCSLRLLILLMCPGK